MADHNKGKSTSLQSSETETERPIEDLIRLEEVRSRHRQEEMLLTKVPAKEAGGLARMRMSNEARAVASQDRYRVLLAISVSVIFCATVLGCVALSAKELAPLLISPLAVLLGTLFGRTTTPSPLPPVPPSQS